MTLSVSYGAVPAAASLRFCSAARETLEAIHPRFTAQRLDHAAHGHHMPDGS